MLNDVKRSGGAVNRRLLHVPQVPRIAVEECGTGPLVMFLHGIGGNRSNWSAQLEVFSEFFRAVAWDARGYGDSDDYEGELEFADFSRDVVRVLDHLRVDRAHLVGLSMGGRVALDCALLFPERVASITLTSTFAGFSQSLAPEKQAEFLRLRLKPLVEDGKDPIDLAPNVIPSLVGPSAPARVMDEMTASMARLRKVSYIKAVKAAATFERSADLPSVDAPTLVVSGEHDRQPLPSAAREMAAAIPGAQFVLIPEAGHLVNLEQPERFNRVVIEYLLTQPVDR